MNRLAKNKHIIMYGASLAVMLFLMRLLDYRFIIIDNWLEIYIGAIAIIFTSLGIWLALKLSSPRVKTIHVEKEVYVYSNEGFVLDETILTRLNISRRELEVLQLMAEGLSNQEIAQRLFVSLNTIKTHSSNILASWRSTAAPRPLIRPKSLILLPENYSTLV